MNSAEHLLISHLNSSLEMVIMDLKQICGQQVSVCML